MSLAIQYFLSIVANYNSAIYPVQLVFFAFGIMAVYFLFKDKVERNHFIGGLLTIIWLWMVIVYHIFYFTRLQPGAFFFGILFIVQAIFFFLETFQDKNLIFNFKYNFKGYLAVFFILYGLIVYPLFSSIMGGSFSVILTLGLPAPTIILTFGFLMLTNKRFSRYLLIIPTLLAITGTAAAFYYGLFQDVFLLFAAVVANIYLMPKRRFEEAETFSLS